MHETVYFWYIHSTDTTNTKNYLECWLWVCFASINLSFIYSVLSILLMRFSQQVWCWTLEKLSERPKDNAVTTLHVSKAFFILFPIYSSCIPSQLCLSVSWYRASLLLSSLAPCENNMMALTSSHQLKWVTTNSWTLSTANTYKWAVLF